MKLETKRIFKKVLGLVLVFSIIMPYFASGAIAYATTAILNNEKLKLGNGSSESVNAKGTLNQPFYYDTTSSTWYKLTYSNYPLSYSIGVDGDGTSEWNKNGTIISDNSMASQVIDTSAYVSQSAIQGYGTIVSTGNVTINGKIFEVKNTYSLDSDKSFIKATTKITNKSESNTRNVRFWVGTPDDFIAGSDVNTKTRGNIINGVFTPITNMTDKASVVQISSAGSSVLFYTTKTKTNTVVAGLGIYNLCEQNPDAIPTTQVGDNSYGIYARLNDLAKNESDEFTWYYAAGDLDSIANIASEVNQDSVNSQITTPAAVTVESVESLEEVIVSNGTAKSAIGLPEMVDVTLSNSTTSAAVTWDNGNPDYDGNVAGTYKFTGTLNLPHGVTNPNNYKAIVNVIVKSNGQITGSAVTYVNSLDDITVKNGTDIEELELPEIVDITLSNSTTSAAVTWDNGNPDYDRNVAGKYKFTGTLNLPHGITNPDNYKAIINVIVKIAEGNQQIIPEAATIEGITNVGQIFNLIVGIITHGVSSSSNSSDHHDNSRSTTLTDTNKSSEKTKPVDNNASIQPTTTENTQGSSGIQGITSDSQNENINEPDKNVETNLPVDNEKNGSMEKNTEVLTETAEETQTVPQESITEAKSGNSEVTDESDSSINNYQTSDKTDTVKKSGLMRFLPSIGNSILNDNSPTGPIIDLNLDISVNSKIGGRTVTATAKGLKPFSEVKIVIYSEPRVLGVGKVDASGKAVITGTFPDDLEAEQHTIMAVGVGNQGQELQSIGGFKLAASGIVTAISNPGQVITPLKPNDSRLIRAVNAGKPVYDVGRYPGVVATIMVTITAFLALIGTGGLSGSTKKSSNTKNSKGKLAGVATKKLKTLKPSESRWGDVHKTWAFPGTATTDLWGSTIPNKFGKFSAIVSRVLVDGSWSRAMFGSAGYILWIVGAIFGIVSAYSVNFMALPPALPIIFVIITLGILDSAAGAIAWIVITFCAIVTGNVTAWADVRTLLGIFVLFSSLPLLAHCIRPLRRSISGDFKEIFDRVADYVMPPVSLAFAASSMIKALNGLSGLQLYTQEEFNKVRLIVGAVFILRMILEDITTYLYPIRSIKVQPEKLVSVGNVIQWISVVVRVGVFLLIAEPFFGLGWVTYVSAVITTIPKIMKIYEDSLPNFKLLHKWYPRGNLKFTIFMIIGMYLSAWLLKQGSGDGWSQQTYIILLLPGFISSCIEFFAREGGDWLDSWLNRIMGTGVWSLSLSIVLGIISLV